MTAMNARLTLKRFLGILALATVFSSCGDDDGPFVGAFCRDDRDCGGMYCVDDNGGTCLPPCRETFDCGPGYECRDRSRRGAGGDVRVCRPN